MEGSLPLVPLATLAPLVEGDILEGSDRDRGRPDAIVSNS